MTETTTTELVAGTSDVQAAIDAGSALTTPVELVEGQDYAVVVPPGGRVERIVNDLDQYRDHPRRKTGSVTVHTATSLVAYLAKHGRDETEVWADVTASRVVAVVNAHATTEAAGWGDHRAVLQLHKTPSWQAWLRLNGQLVDQIAFAEHLQDRSVDIVSPDSATMLEIAQTFSANRRVGFDSSQRLSSGEVQLRWHEDIDAKAGRKGDIAIPETFELALQPYEGSQIYKVRARLRYRINDGRLSIGYALERPDDVLRAAFTDMTDEIGTESGRDVWHGVPVSA